MAQSEEHLFNLDRLEELLEEWKSILPKNAGKPLALAMGSTSKYTLWHRSIDSTARVLVSLKRKGEAFR